MKLTKEEFCQFNLKSKIQLIEKDGCFITRRICSDLYLISLYSLYNFHVEVTYNIPRFRTTSIIPVINIEIINLYDLYLNTNSNKKYDISLE